MQRTGHASIASEASHDKYRFWHLRLGNASESDLVELAKQDFLGKYKLEKLEFYDDCIQGKQHKVKFGSGMHHSSRSFEYVH